MIMDKLDLRPLYLFVQVAEAGSFSKAAAALSIGQSALSREIKLIPPRILNDPIGWWFSCLMKASKPASATC